MKDKIVSADEAIAIIRDRDVICTSGFVGVGTPDELLLALEKRYRETRHPSDLTLLFAAAPGDSKDRGLNRLAHDGLIKRVVGGHWALVPRLGELAACFVGAGLACQRIDRAAVDEALALGAGERSQRQTEVAVGAVGNCWMSEDRQGYTMLSHRS